MMKLGETNYLQPRIATGRVTGDKTRMYIVDDYLFEGCVDAVTRAELDDDIPVTVYGYVDVHHPVIMAGTWEEVTAGFRRAALRHLAAQGFAREDDDGDFIALRNLRAAGGGS